MLHLKDRQLARRLLRKDQRAFEEFFETNFGRLTRFCARRIPDPDLCEDIVQETFVKAVANLHTYRGEASLFTWLCRICINEAADWLRGPHAKRMEFHGGSSFPAARADESAAAAIADAGLDVRESVHLVLDRLPRRYALALEWKYIHGYSVPEVGRRLGLGTIATQSLLARARARFRSRWASLEGEQGASGGLR